MSIALKRAREVFSYDAATGEIRWRICKDKRCPEGTIAGYLNDQGYQIVIVDRQKMRAHRVAWMLHYGEEPPEFLDHVNGNRSDNRIENLRAATKQQNAFNSRGKRKGLKGATFDKKAGKWMAQIMRDGKNNFLGYHLSELVAHEAYVQGAKRFHREFARAA